MQVSVCGDKAAKPFFDGNLLGAKSVINDGYIERNVFVVVYFRRGTYECPNGAALEVTDAQRRGVRLLSARAEKHKSSKSRNVFRLNVRNIFPYFSVPSLTKRDGTRVVPLCKRASHAALTPDTLSIAPTHQTFLPFRGVTPTLLFKLKTALDKNHIETTQTTPRQAKSISTAQDKTRPKNIRQFQMDNQRCATFTSGSRHTTTSILGHPRTSPTRPHIFAATYFETINTHSGQPVKSIGHI